MGNRYWDGSFRISDEDLRKLAFSKGKQLTVPANTLVPACHLTRERINPSMV
jgi:hypothetical protein